MAREKQREEGYSTLPQYRQWRRKSDAAQTRSGELKRDHHRCERDQVHKQRPHMHIGGWGVGCLSVCVCVRGTGYFSK